MHLANYTSIGSYFITIEILVHTRKSKIHIESYLFDLFILSILFKFPIGIRLFIFLNQINILGLRDMVGKATSQPSTK